MDTRYLTVADVIALHEFIMRKLNTAPAPLRSESILESAVMRCQMAAYYEDADLIRQATLLAVGVSQAQAFLDGNKRTAYIACMVFLSANNLKYSGDPIALAKQLENVAEHSDDLTEATTAFEAWLRSHIDPIA